MCTLFISKSPKSKEIFPFEASSAGVLPKPALCSLSSFLGTFPRLLFTSLTLEAKGGFKTFCFTPGRQLQTQAALAGRGKAVLAPVRPEKQMTWIKLCSSWESGMSLQIGKALLTCQAGAQRVGPWSSSSVSLADVKGCPCHPGMLRNLLDPRLHPGLWRGSCVGAVGAEGRAAVCSGAEAEPRALPRKKTLLLGKSSPSAPHFCSQTEFLPLLYLLLPWI